MISALYSNPNWDDEKNERPRRIEELNAHFNEAIELLYHPERAKEREQEIDWDNPFWAATKRGLDKTLQLLPEQRRKQMRVVFDEDQERARTESRKQIDQL